MAEQTFISVNPENFITILLMGGLGYGLLALAVQFFKKGGVSGASG